MRVSDGDSHTCFLQSELSESVLDRDVRRGKTLGGLPRDRIELALGHCLVGGVLDPGHLTAIIQVANHAEKEYERTICRPRDGAQQRHRVDDLAMKPSCRSHPPATGGMTATSSPVRTMVLAVA